MPALTLRPSLRPIIALAPIRPVVSTAPFASSRQHRKASTGRDQSGTQGRPRARRDKTKPTIEDFERLAKVGKAGPDKATALLQQSQETLACLPLDERKEKAAAAGGGRIFQWLRTQRDVMTRAQHLSGRLAGALCWHLEAEGLNDHVWKWIDIMEDSMATDSCKHDHHHQMMWAGRLLAALVAAKIEWHPEKNPEAGLEVLMHAIARYPRSRDKGGIRWSTALTDVTEALQRADTVPCSEHMFEQFIDVLSKMDTGSPRRRAKRLAFSLLYHPTKPNVEPALQHWREASARRAEHSKSIDAPARIAQVPFLLRAAYILRYAKRVADATWLEKMVRDGHRKQWGERGAIKRALDWDPKLAMVRQGSVNADRDLLQAWDLAFEPRKRWRWT